MLSVVWESDVRNEGIAAGREEAERQKQERSEANNALIKALEALIRENKKYVKIVEMKKKLKNVWVGEQMEFEELNEKKYVNRLLRKMRKEEDFRVRIAEAWADVEAARADVEKARTGVEKTKVAALERENEILKSQYKIMRDIFMEYCERKR